MPAGQAQHFKKANAHRHTDLWVLQKCGFMVNAASGSVAERVVSANPGAPHHLLLPGLMNAQVRCVYQSTQDQVGEVMTEILKVHPGEASGGTELYDKWRIEVFIRCSGVQQHKI